MNIVLFTLGSVVLVSMLSLAGITLFFWSERFIRAALLPLVSFSTGALLGDVFIHILPELAEDADRFQASLLIVLGGIVFSFVVEKFVRWRHCHVIPNQNHDDCHHHHHHVGVMALVGDCLHNAIDGIVIAAAFLAGIPIGISTTIAVMFHEIPQEISDMAILLHSGFTKKSALFFNFLSALTAIAGATVVLLLSGSSGALESAMLPFAAGNLLYIAGSDLIPELHQHSKLRQAPLQLLAMLAGMAVMYGLLFLE